MSHNGYIYQPLTLDGTGAVDTTNEQMKVDGTTPKQFYITPQSDQRILLLTRCLVYVRDAGIWSSEKFAAITGGLANGVRFDITDDSFTVIKALTPLPIKTNADWKGHLCYDAVIDTVGAGDSFLSARWSFFKDLKGPGIYLHQGERFVCTIQDDLSSLVDMHVNIRGEVTAT